MSDDLIARILATTHLVDCAEDWQDIADDPRFPVPMRHEAQAYANCIWAELGMDTRAKP